MLKIIFSMMLLLSTGLQGANLHALFVCDSLGRNIQKACLNDLKQFKREAVKCANLADLDLNEIVLVGQSTLPGNLFKQIKMLNPGPDDVIFFAFTGHGYRTTKKEGNPWPDMYFTKTKSGVDFKKVVTLLNNKNCRFVLAIADCCNNFIDKNDSFDEDEGIIPKDIALLKSSYRTLFRDMEGVVAVCSSKEGQYSWCTQDGAIFTGAFFRQLSFAVNGHKELAWDAILREASLEVETLQDPYYEITR